MKAIIRRIEGERQVLAGTVLAGCLECNADVTYERTAPLDVEVPIQCESCGFEIGLRRVGPDLAAVRRPYGCRRFAHVDSSNLAAAGVRGKFLLVRFRSGGTYRYAGAAHLFPDLLRAPSVGKFFHREVKGKFAGERLCVRYGCGRPAKVSSNQVMCSECLHPDRPSE